LAFFIKVISTRENPVNFEGDRRIHAEWITLFLVPKGARLNHGGINFNDSFAKIIPRVTTQKLPVERLKNRKVSFRSGE
jgi:hypothetical protein